VASLSGPLLKRLKLLRISPFWGEPEAPGAARFVAGGRRTPRCFLRDRPCRASRKVLGRQILARNFWAEAVSNLSLLALEPVSVGEREIPPGKGSARPETAAALLASLGRLLAAETTPTRVSGSKAAESQRLFRLRQEIGIAQDCVVGLVGLKPASR
jgi:hypothetical protein